MSKSFQIVLIVGQMRSGTSAVSEIVHTLGIPMGVAFLAPVPPTYRCEWEDMALAEAMARHWVRGEVPAGGLQVWWQNYLDRRSKHAAKVLGTDRWGAKTPPLCLVLDTLMADTLKAGYTALIHVDRPQGSVDASVRRTFSPDLIDRALETNAKIRGKLKDLPCHLRVPYDELVSYPTTWVRKIAGLLEVDDASRIADAASRVMEPTSKWDGQQHSGSLAAAHS